MIKKLCAALAVIAVGSSSIVFASDSGGIKGGGRYGEAGCGLGSMAFGDQKGAVQILAATTNGLFGTQTFGISSGTSNCSGLSGAQASRVFIEANREALAKDISRGSGETIGTLSWINGCADSHVVGAALQKNFSAIFPNQSVSDDQVTAAILGQLKGDKSLGCQMLG
jgi:hypothetical protein